MSTSTSLEFFVGLPIADFLDIANEVIEIGKQKQLRTSGRNRW